MNPTRPVDTPSEPAAPWWRFPIVWLALSGPAVVVAASVASAAIAWQHIDPVVAHTAEGRALRAADDMSAPGIDAKDPLAPALKARNAAALPRPRDAGR